MATYLAYLYLWYLYTVQELRWDTDVAEAVAAIKQQQSKADAHGGAAKQRGESCFSPNPSPRALTSILTL